MQLKSIRRGVAYGFYPQNDKYVIYFRDGGDEMSYKENQGQTFEYLNKLRYTSPIFVLNAISEFLLSPTKKKHEKDIEGMNNIFKNYSVQMDGHTYSTMMKLNKYFGKFGITLEKKAFATYEITMVTQESLHMLLNFIVVYFGIISSINDNDLEISSA
jgi:hypothetical protein